MGDRVNIVVTTDHTSGVVLYSHWGGYRMPKTIAKFISNTGRLDTDYFTRNLMCSMIADGIIADDNSRSGFDLISADNNAGEMILNAFQDELSFGIGLNLAGDREYPVIVINPEVQSIWLMPDQEVVTTGECVSRALRYKEIPFGDFKKISSWSELKSLASPELVAI